MKHRCVLCFLILAILMLAGCGAIDRSERMMDDLTREATEVPEATEPPAAEPTEPPDDPDAAPDFEMPDPLDEAFGFYSQMQQTLALPMTPDGLKAALKAEGIEKLPTEDGVRLETYVNDGGQCYALEVVAKRMNVETAEKALTAILKQLGQSEKDVEKALEDVGVELIQNPSNGLVELGAYGVRVADMNEELHLLVHKL